MPTFLTAFGECKTLAEWAHDPRCVVSLATLSNRIREQWQAEKALTEPSRSPADRWRQPIVAFGESKSLLEWELDERAHSSAQLILSRLRHGWKPEEAISTAAPSVTRRIEPRNLKTYFGKTLTEWARDPRCRVSRYTLERNFRAHLPLEEALVFRKRKAAPAEEVNRVDTKEEALRLLAGQGELWQYVGGAEPRVSILVENERHELSAETFRTLESEGLLRLFYSSDSTRQYGLSSLGKQQAAT